MATCLVVLMDAGAPDRMIGALRRRGVRVTVTDVGPDAATALMASDWSGIVAVGGRISPYDERTVPFTEIGGLLARGVSRGVPTLGIGGGAHVLSAALGGRPSTPQDELRVSVRALRRTEEGRHDLLFRHAPADPAWLDCSLLSLEGLPVGAQVLASGEDGRPEAVRLGARAWAVQGFPHLDRPAFEHCMASSAARTQMPAPLQADVTRAAERLDDLQQAWEPFLEAFCDLVADQVATRTDRGSRSRFPRRR